MDIKDIVKAAGKQGWTIERTKGNHIKLTPPDPTMSQVILPGTPSDWRSLKNVTSQLRRAGLKI